MFDERECAMGFKVGTMVMSSTSTPREIIICIF
jgi:hypothetical protein